MDRTPGPGVQGDVSRVSDPCGHARSVSGMFARIADWYDLLNRVLSGGLDRYWRYRLARHVTPGPTGRVLDLAAGTLDVALEIVRQHPGARVPALDFCRPMLQRGRNKLSGATARAIWPVAADGRRLPLAAASVDCVTIAFGIRNILPRSGAFAEILRVLTPGGRLCVLEFGAGRTPILRGLYNFYLNRVLPAVGRAVSGDPDAYRYLADSIMTFPTADELAGEMTDAGFGRVFHLPLTAGVVRLHVAEKPHARPAGPTPMPGGALSDSTTTATKHPTARTRKAAPGRTAGTAATGETSATGTAAPTRAAARSTPKKKRAAGGDQTGKRTPGN